MRPKNTCRWNIEASGLDLFLRTFCYEKKHRSVEPAGCTVCSFEGECPNLFLGYTDGQAIIHHHFWVIYGNIPFHQQVESTKPNIFPDILGWFIPQPTLRYVASHIFSSHGCMGPEWSGRLVMVGRWINHAKRIQKVQSCLNMELMSRQVWWFKFINLVNHHVSMGFFHVFSTIQSHPFFGISRHWQFHALEPATRATHQACRLLISSESCVFSLLRACSLWPCLTSNMLASHGSRYGQGTWYVMGDWTKNYGIIYIEWFKQTLWDMYIYSII